jgi:multicomponent Na+:H+ antiporter subunit E
MTPYVYNLSLMLVWLGITGDVSLPNMGIGFLLGYGILAFALSSDPRFRAYARRLPRLVVFLLSFLRAMLMSNLRVAYDVVTPTHLMRPAIIRMPLAANTPGEITLLANLISLTPGTLSLDVDAEGQALFIHVMYLDNEDETMAELKRLEARLLELMR